MRWVLDGSLALAWALPDEHSGSAERFLQGLAKEDELRVPSLWWYEVSNALRAAQRRRRLNEAEVARILELYRALRLLTDTDLGPELGWRLVSLAREHDLSACDAAYLELALRKDAGLATLDRKLGRAAQRAGVKTPG